MKFPYTAWRLMPSFRPAQVELIKGTDSCGQPFHIDGSGKYFRLSELFATKGDAISAGWARVNAQLANIEKLEAGIAKKVVQLQKATK